MTDVQIGLIILAVCGVLWAALDIALWLRRRGLRRELRQHSHYADPGRIHRETQRALDGLAAHKERRS